MKRTVLLSIVAATVLFTGCSEETKKAASETATAAKETTQSAVNDAKEVVSETAQKAVETSKEVVQEAKEKASEAIEATKEAAAPVVEATKEAVEETVSSMTGETNETTASVPDTEEAAVPTPVPASEAEDTSASTSADNEAGKALYTKCASCHGPDGKTKALGKSEVIAGQSAPDLETKIAEYKAGTRDVAGMGALMKGQVATLSDDDIKAVAAYISTL